MDVLLLPVGGDPDVGSFSSTISVRTIWEPFPREVNIRDMETARATAPTDRIVWRLRDATCLMAMKSSKLLA